MKSLITRWKAGAVVKALLGEGLEILDGLGRHIRPKLDHHLPFGGLDYRNFVGIHLSLF